MRLETLTLENFQGKASATFTFDGRSASIYGDNETGKTTLFNSITWLLTGKASTGAKNFTPKTKDANGEDVHYLDHSVEAVFTDDRGARRTFKRLLRENYKRKHGSATKEFDGHVVDYYLDGVPVKEREFNRAVEQIFGAEQQMKALMMPDYFAESLPWEKRRQLLLEVCGDITDDDIIDGTPELFELRNRLLMPGSNDQYYSVAEYRKVASSQMAAVNQQLQALPARIDEATRSMPDLRELPTEDSLQREIGQLETDKKGKEKALLQLQSSDKDLNAIRAQVAEAQAEMAEARAAYIEQHTAKNSDKREQAGTLREQVLAAQADRIAHEGGVPRRYCSVLHAPAGATGGGGGHRQRGRQHLHGDERGHHRDTGRHEDHW